MVFSASLAQRTRDALAPRKNIVEKKLFGGVGFLLDGNLLVCVWKDMLIARLGPEDGRAALREPHVREFDVTGRPMRGWVMVEPEGVEHDDQLRAWIQRAAEFVTALPSKSPGKPGESG